MQLCLPSGEKIKFHTHFLLLILVFPANYSILYFMTWVKIDGVIKRASQ